MGPVENGCGLCIDGETENPRWKWKGCKKTPSCVVPSSLGRVDLPYTEQQGNDVSPLTNACIP
jgi:hypothetical protein